MPVKLMCPVKGRSFTIRSATEEKVSGRKIKCPLCHAVHDAVFAPPELPDQAEVYEEPVPPVDAPTYRLFSVQAVTLATFLGSFLGGGIVFAANFHRLGRRGPAVQSVVLGVLGSIVIGVLAFHLPEQVPGVLVWLPAILILQYVAKQVFGRILADHEAAGGKLVSMWYAALIGVIGLVIVGGGILLYILMNPAFPGEKLEVGKDEVYYSGEATEADARKLAADLKELGVFGHAGASVHLEKSSGSFAVSIVFRVRAWKDPEMKSALREVGEALADGGFGRPITMKMCDDGAEVRYTTTIR